MPVVDANSTAGPALPPTVHVHEGSLSRIHGLKHHKLTALHDPQLVGLLSAESAESAEVVPVAPAVVGAATAVPATAASDPAAGSDSASDGSTSAEVPIVVVKRDVPITPSPVVALGTSQTDSNGIVKMCPGRIRHF